MVTLDVEVDIVVGITVTVVVGASVVTVDAVTLLGGCQVIVET